jgi:hypothetical protein
VNSEHSFLLSGGQSKWNADKLYYCQVPKLEHGNYWKKEKRKKKAPPAETCQSLSAH